MVDIQNSNQTQNNNPLIIPSPPPNVPAPIFLNLPVATKLTRCNYLTWRSQIEPILHGYQLHNFLTNPPPNPTTTDATGLPQINPAFVPWHQQDQLILGWLRSCLTEPLQAQVISCLTARDLWESLRSTFSATSRARLSELRRQLQTTSKGGLSCADFVQKMRSIADELAFIGSPVSEDDLVLLILSGLGPDFNSFVVAAQTRSEPLRMPELQAMLLTHESLLLAQNVIGSSSTNPSVFYSDPKPNQFAPLKPINSFSNLERYRSPKNNSNFRPRFQNSSPRITNFPSRGPLLQTPNIPTLPHTRPPYSSSGNTLICQICYKRGHSARQCYKRCDARYFDSPAQHSSQPQAFFAQPPPQPQIFTTQSNSVPASSMPPPLAEWIVDSGASHHVTNDINSLSSFLPYEGFNALHIGNGSGNHDSSSSSQTN